MWFAIKQETFTVATHLSVYEVKYSRCGSNVLLFDETRDDANKIYSFIQLYTLCLSVITYSRKGGLLEVLLTFPLRVHGIQNRLSLRLIPFSQLVDLPLHFCVQTSHSLLQFLVGEKLQLQDTASLYIQVIFFIMPKAALFQNRCRECELYIVQNAKWWIALSCYI